jgi:hypothetical protein
MTTQIEFWRKEADSCDRVMYLPKCPKANSFCKLIGVKLIVGERKMDEAYEWLDACGLRVSFYEPAYHAEIQLSSLGG